MRSSVFSVRVAAGVIGAMTVLSSCSSAEDGAQADRARQLGCTEVPAGATAAIRSSLYSSFSLSGGGVGFEREGLWLVAVSLTDAEGLTENAAFAVGLTADPISVTAASDYAREVSSAPAKPLPAADDALDCIVTTSW